MEVKFSINNRPFTVNPSTVPVDTTLNAFIRSYARLTGTKFMCLEGGCGVCIVNITGLKTSSNELRSIAVNSCLWLVYACHGLNVTTIEGLGGREYGYHPIQHTLYEYNGSQCGYCSPAMIMNMYSLLEQNGGKVTQQQVENSFGGNICRCTGYRPILDAFKSLTIDSTIGDIEDVASTSCCRSKKSKHYRHTSISCGTTTLGELYSTLHLTFCDSRVWYRVTSLQQLIDTLMTIKDEYMLVAGDTAHGVYRRSTNIKHFIDVNSVLELHKISSRRSKLTIGANVSLNEAMDILESVAVDKSDFSYCRELAKHIDLVATVPIRNTGTIAGNLSIKHQHNEFPSDIFLLLETVGAELNIISLDGAILSYSPKEFLSLDMRQKIILNITLPKLPANQFTFRSYKIMPRAQNAHAMLNAGFLFEFETSGVKKSVKSCRICYGGINPNFIHAEETESLLTGVEDFYTNECIQRAVSSLQHELNPDAVLPDPSPEYRKRLAISLFYRFCLNTTTRKARYEFRSGATAIERPISSGVQSFDTNENLWPLTEPVLKNEGLFQCAGEAQYTNDLFSQYSVGEELWAAFVQTTEFNEKIIKIDPSKALKIPGVHSFYTAKDIPGKNSFTRIEPNAGMIEDERILVEIDSITQYNGQPCGIILANSMALANYAASQVKITYKKIKGKEPLVTGNVLSVLDSLREQQEDQNDQEIEDPPAETDEAVSLISINGEYEIGTQYHYPMEPQTTFCMPSDDGGLNVFAATQWPDMVQFAISKSLAIPNNKINVTVRRVGGAYGSKIARSALVASSCALCCYLANRPVRFVMTIEAMMSICGKRYPCANKYQLTAETNTGRIRSLNNFYVQDYGYSLNEMNDQSVLNTFLLGYISDRWRHSGKTLLTNVNISTWCRAPGSTESIAMGETIIEHVAQKLKMDPVHVRLNNMSDRDVWKSSVKSILTDIDYYERRREIERFNDRNRWRKRGIAFIQMKYPIGYIGSFSSYVAIYHGDGTVIVSHGGVDFGQGINTKAAQIAAFVLNIPLEMVQVKATNSESGANCIYTAATVGSDSVCLATKRACEILLKRIKPIRDRMPENVKWQEIVENCYRNFVDLTARYTFIPSDAKNYFVYGCSCAEIEWDALTGNLQIHRVDLIEDTGRSMSPLIDVGQVEGSFIMSLGYWLTEKYVYDRITGQLLTNRTWNYKTPGAKDIPIDFRVKFIETENTNNRVGVLRSKATGEPAVALGYVVVCALRHALNSVLKDNGQSETFLPLGSGLTPDELCLAAPVNMDHFLIE